MSTSTSPLFKVLNGGGMSATAVALVTRTSRDYVTMDDLLYLEVIGVSTQIKAVTASIHSGSVLHTGYGAWQRVKPVKGMKYDVATERFLGRQYKATIFPKPEYGLFLFPQMVPGYKPITTEAWREQDTEAKVQPWHLFAQVIASRTIYPVKQEWAIDLWKVAREMPSNDLGGHVVSSLSVRGYIPWAYSVDGTQLDAVIAAVAAKKMP